MAEFVQILARNNVKWSNREGPNTLEARIWTAWFKIPFSDFGAKVLAPGEVWRFNAARNMIGQDMPWSDTPNVTDNKSAIATARSRFLRKFILFIFAAEYPGINVFQEEHLLGWQAEIQIKLESLKFQSRAVLIPYQSLFLGKIKGERIRRIAIYVHLNNKDVVSRVKSELQPLVVEILERLEGDCNIWGGRIFHSVWQHIHLFEQDVPRLSRR